MAEKSIGDRVRSFVEGKRPDPAEVRNHLVVTGPSDAVQRLLASARAGDEQGPEVRLGDGEWPVEYEAERVRVRHGTWLTVDEHGISGQREQHDEEAQAIFAFASSEPLDDRIARASAQHPDLVFRYASFRHRRHRDDVARGGVWRAGRCVAEHVHTVGDEPQGATDRELQRWHAEQLARIVEETERLELPAELILAAAPAMRDDGPWMADDRRTRILEATCRVIVRDGAAGVRVAAIAREAGVSNALPIYYFGSVDEVIRAAFAQHEERAWAKTDARLDGIDDPLEALRRLLLDELDTTDEARASAVLWAEVEQLAVFDDAVRTTVLARRARYDQRLEECLRSAQAAGAVAASVDPRTAVGGLSALIDGLIHALLIGARTGDEARRQAEDAITRLAPPA